MNVVASALAPIAPTLSWADAASKAWDIAIIGAGPAGSSAAIALAARGRSILLIDKSPFPRSKVCGCCINAAALASLSDLGANDLPQETLRFQ